MNQEKLNVYLALQSACATLRQGIEESRDVSGQIKTLLADEVLHSYTLQNTSTLQTNPSLLTAMWRALQRIAGLMHHFHKQEPEPEIKAQEGETDSNEAEGWFPAWFGYEFWATHADSVQFGIKFSLGAILCALVVEALSWPGINTAIPTCLVAAQTSLGPTTGYRYYVCRAQSLADSAPTFMCGHSSPNSTPLPALP